MNKKKKVLKTIFTVLVLGALIVPLMSCNSAADDTESSESQPAVVQRGNLTVDITAAGNLALSLTEDLAIDIFYQQGTIEEVLVEEGDPVLLGGPDQVAHQGLGFHVILRVQREEITVGGCGPLGRP